MNTDSDKDIIASVITLVKEGQDVLREEPAYQNCSTTMEYVQGQQNLRKSKAISRVVNNRLRKAVYELAASLTDVRQIWRYDAQNDDFKHQAELLSKLAQAWWMDVKGAAALQDAIVYSACGGSGYLWVQWNPVSEQVELLPVDPRDLVPIGAVYGASIQDWGGIALRRTMNFEAAAEQWPSKREALKAKKGTLWPARNSGGRLSKVITNAWQHLTRNASVEQPKEGGVDVLYIYKKDFSRNTGDVPITMGEGNFSYEVYPVGATMANGKKATVQDALLYPRGRLIICTEHDVLWDGPNPNWHGRFPAVRVTLLPAPWTLLGVAPAGEAKGLQDGLNEALRGLEDGIAQWIRRGVIADKNAISKQALNALDTRESGLKALVNPSAGEGFKVVDGPQLPQWYMETFKYYHDAIDDCLGVRNIQQLQALKQVPSADTVDRMMESLTPQLRLMAHNVGQALCDLGEMFKTLVFQHYDMRRRIEILGPGGIVVEDLDFDPMQLVPSNLEGSTRSERARRFEKNFRFTVQPGTFLEVSHTQQRMTAIQLTRMQLLDPWSLWYQLDMPNSGKPPDGAESITDRIVAARKLGLMPGPTPEMIEMQQKLALIQGAQALGEAGPAGIQGMASMMGGANNSGVGPEGGRPPSGEKPPQLMQKGERIVMSESGR